MKVLTLDSPADARAFYEDRYRHGYMDCWDRDKLGAVAEVLGDIALAPGARILDFGCGTGVFTELMGRLHPQAEVYGCDPSTAAVRQAASRCEGANFFCLDREFSEGHAGAFDLIVTHHVLEHVVDLQETAGEIVALVKPGGRMMHILPCGNPGSLHHQICGFYHDGIEPDAGNRFFFEDPSHLRRLTTEELCAAFAPAGFRMARAVYSDQFWGGIRFITEGSPSQILELFDPWRSKPGNRVRVLGWRLAMLALFAARAPVLALGRVGHLLQRFRQGTRQLDARRALLILAIVPPALLFYLPSLLADCAVRYLARREWRCHRDRPGGTEIMALFEGGWEN
jgi:SAM-dependent methyltransferase